MKTRTNGDRRIKISRNKSTEVQRTRTVKLKARKMCIQSSKESNESAEMPSRSERRTLRTNEEITMMTLMISTRSIGTRPINSLRVASHKTKGNNMAGKSTMKINKMKVMTRRMTNIRKMKWSKTQGIMVIKLTETIK